MAKTPRKTTRQVGRPRKPPAELLSIEVMVKFTGPAAEMIKRAVAVEGDNRANFLRRAGVKLAREVLGIPPVSDKK
jgi:hypothetical protein